MSLIVDKVSKRYKFDWVLKDTSFEANAGEIFGIFGVSGGGKSTVLASLHSESARNGGSVLLNGSNPRHLISISNADREPSFFSGIFGRKTPAKSVVTEVRDLIESSEVGKDSALLLDDPFCSLDLRNRLDLFDQIRAKVKDTQAVALFASPRFDDILAFCDRVGVLSNGEIVQTGNPQDVYENPVSATVAQIVGRNNIFSARRLSSSKADAAVFVTMDGEHRLTTEGADVKTLGPLNQNILLGIRPEQVSISFGASFPEDNLIKGTIEDVQQLGHFAVISLNCQGLALTASVPRAIGLNPGDECMVGLPPDRIRVFAQ